MHKTFSDVSDPFSLSQRSHLAWTRGNVSVKIVDYSQTQGLNLVVKKKKQFWGDL